MLYEITPTKVAKESQQAINDGFTVIVNQGGTRSGKTYSIADLLIGMAFRPELSLSISVCSISLPHLKRGVMRDWQEIMEAKGEYNPNRHNLTDKLYKYPSGSFIEFFSVDQAEKVRGPSRDVLFINEANLLTLDTWRQLTVRTTGLVLIDYNPADEMHWIYDEVLTRKDCKFIQSSYLDNPFLAALTRENIERLKDIDPNFWKIYGLGERGISQATVYQGFQMFDQWPDIDYCFGLDFGFTHPNALVKVGIDETNLYFEECLYEPGMNSLRLLETIRPIVEDKYVWCDSARPEIIQDLQDGGINAHKTEKYEGSVKDGIDFIRSHSIFVHRESVNFQKEMRSYKWKTRVNGQTIDEPVKAFDDLMDAGRYGAISLKDQFSPILTFHK